MMKKIILNSAFAQTGTRALEVSNLSLGIAKYGGYDKKDQKFAQLDRRRRTGR